MSAPQHPDDGLVSDQAIESISGDQAPFVELVVTSK